MRNIILLLFILLAPIVTYADKAQIISTNPTTGAKSWQIQRHGVSFSLTQILPDQLKAFYVGRGFTLPQIELYTSSCVYMTVLRNDDAPGDIHFVSNKWSILVNGKPHPLKSVNQWIEVLTTKEVKKSALIAFRWAQFPPEQVYQPGGDWNQGMLSVGMPDETYFDVVAKWDIAGKDFTAELRGVTCAKY